MAEQSTGKKIAIIGGETLLGREVKEVVEGRGSAGKLHAYGIEGEEIERASDQGQQQSRVQAAAEGLTPGPAVGDDRPTFDL